MLDMEMANPHALNLKELLLSFKRRSFLLMPGKHSGLVNAHARFEELNKAFLTLLDHSLELRDLKRTDVLPGEINTRKFEFLVPIREGSAMLWRTAITKTYKEVVAEPKERPPVIERRLSVIERRNSVVEALGHTEEWKEMLEKLKDGATPTYIKKRVSIVGTTTCKFVQV